MTATLTPYLRSAPPFQPPFDDEMDLARTPVLTAWAAELPFETTAAPAPRVHPDAGTDRRRSDDLPAPGPWARRFIQAALESLAGRRSAAQLQASTSTPVFLGLQRACAKTSARGPQPPVLVRSVHVTEPADGVAEVCAVVSRPAADGPRFRAVAARLEGHGRQWRCVTLQIG